MAKAFEVNRSPFASKKESDNPPAPAASKTRVTGWELPQESSSEKEEAALPPPPPKHTLENAGFITDRAAREKKRSREWERRAENRPYVFRGVQVEIRDEVNAVARDVDVSASDIARAFFEFSLESYSAGFLKIEPCFKQGKMTLFPSLWGQRGWYTAAQSTSMTKKNQPPRKKTKDKKQLVMVSYRHLPEKIFLALSEISHKNRVTMGEVVTYLLSYALDAYRSKTLLLEPHEKL